jgi:hypothetical protein
MRDVARAAAELADALEDHMQCDDLKLGRFVAARRPRLDLHGNLPARR